MKNFFPAFFTYLSVPTGLLLILAIVRYIYREKMAQVFLRLPEERRARFLEAERRIVGAFRLFLWMAPMYLVLLPLSMMYFLDEPIDGIVVDMVLLFALVFVEYHLRQWLIPRLEGLTGIDSAGSV